jgi:hypothetical protein
MSKTIRSAVTLVAIVVGVASYLITAVQLFWADHGDTILDYARRLRNGFDDARFLTYELGKDCGTFYYTVGLPWCAGRVDQLFYSVIDV